MDQHEIEIHGHRVLSDEDARHGLEHLHSALSPDESHVFFEMAKKTGQAEFQDSKNNNFTLVAGQNSTFTVVARKPENHGWF